MGNIVNFNRKNFKNFKPLSAPFDHLTEDERMANSEHLLKYLKDLTMDDLFHFINGGVLDVKKASEKLGLRLD